MTTMKGLHGNTCPRCGGLKHKARVGCEACFRVWQQGPFRFSATFADFIGVDVADVFFHPLGAATWITMPQTERARCPVCGCFRAFSNVSRKACAHCTTLFIATVGTAPEINPIRFHTWMRTQRITLYVKNLALIDDLS